jgi:hypothetical protein
VDYPILRSGKRHLNRVFISVWKAYHPPPGKKYFLSPTVCQYLLLAHPISLIFSHFAFILILFTSIFPLFLLFLHLSFTFLHFFSSPFSNFPHKWHQPIHLPRSNGVFSKIHPFTEKSNNYKWWSWGGGGAGNIVQYSRPKAWELLLWSFANVHWSHFFL